MAYPINMKFVAGQYWYRFVVDYGLDQIVKVYVGLTDENTGETL